MALTKIAPASAPAASQQPRSVFGRPLVLAAVALVLLTAFGWAFLRDPGITAPTRDPAWYTWRANVILESDPGSVAREWGPGSVFSGGYRVTVPLAGALLQRVAGIDQYSFSAFLMIGLPVLTGLALGAGAFRSRRDPLIVPLTMLASAALFLTTPYVGYLDNIMVLFLLSLLVAFLGEARTSWGARAAVFLIAITAAFTHPTTCVILGAVLMAVFGWHFLTSRLSLGAALRSDGPMLMSTGFGMILGLAMWVIGVWGEAASLADAALPPPYTKEFFLNRLGGWFTSLQPVITVPLMAIAIASVVLVARRRREPADTYDMVSVWWLLPLVGTFGFLIPSLTAYPYYRFMNATAAPIALTGLGAFVAVRWLLGRAGRRRAAGAVASLVVVGALGWVFFDGLANRWAGEGSQWADQEARASLAAVHAVVAGAGERPSVFVVNYGDTATAYGWAKTYTNVLRTGLPGDAAERSVTYFGVLEDFLAGRATGGQDPGYTQTSLDHFEEVQARLEAYTEEPLVFVVGQYYQGDVDAAATLASGVSVGPDVSVITGDGLYEPPADLVERARVAAAAESAHLGDHPGPLGNPLHTLRVLAGLFFLLVLPGLIASSWFGLRDGPSRVALIPGISIVLTLLSGIAVLAVWRGPLTTAKGWAAVGVATILALAIRVGRPRLERVLGSFGGFFNRMFAVFSNQSFAALMGVQFLALMGDGVVQGSLAKSIAFGGEKGFDVTSAPSARYLLFVVLALYVPYTFVSPFAGVFIDRFHRRALLAGSNVFRAVVIVVLALLLALFGDGLPDVFLIFTILVTLACTRMLLAIKSAGLPGVLQGKDLLQGNGLSQAGGAVFQIMGGGFALIGTTLAPVWIVALAGGGLYLIAAVVARRVEHLETSRRTTRFAEEAKRVVRDIAAGVREVAHRPAAALGVTSFQALRMEFFGFVALVFALEARFLLTGKDADQTVVAIAGGAGAAGAAIGMVVAQKLKDRVPPVRLLLASMLAIALGVIAFGGVPTLLGFSSILFIGGFGFFLGKISADTIVQQAMPDDFRGRAFSLFDIAYNLGWIVPALVLAIVWDEGRVRPILIASGVVFLCVTMLIWRWATRIRNQLAPQDDLVEMGEEE